MKKFFKKIAKQLLLIVFGILVVSVSVKAATTIGNNIITRGLNVNSLVGETELRVDGTNSTSSSALIMAMGETSRLNFISGEALWPTTWSLGINTGLDLSPNQDFQIRQTADGSGLVDEARLTILKSNGNIGIGTTTPEFNLSVDGSIFATNSFRVGDGNEFVSISYPNGLGFWTNGNPRMTLDSNGRLGIGTTTPISKLAVIGGNSDNSSYSVDVFNSNNNNLFSIRDDGGVFIGKEHTTALANKLTIYDSSSSRLQLEGPLAGININSDNVGDLYIQGSQSAITSYYRDTDYAWSTGMVDNSNHNFSIWFNGSTNPGSKLAIQSNGNIGIGTTTPSEKLVVIGSSIFEGLARFSDTVNITNQTNQSDDVSLTLDSLFTTPASSSARITLRGATSRLRISSAEAVWPTAWSIGINAGLGAVPNQDFQIFQETDGSGLVDEARLTILKSNGNIGIGTITPESKLHVYSGDANATSTIQIGDESASKGSCLKLRDSDGLGWTYCSTLDGTFSCSTTPCN